MNAGKITGYTFLLVLLTALLANVFAASFTDNHNDNTTVGWTSVMTRTWSESNGKMSPSSTGGNSGMIINNTTVGANGTLEVEMTADQWNGHMGGVILRYNSTSSYYFVAVQPGNQYNNSIKFCRNSLDANSGVTVASNFSMNTSFTLRIVMAGSNFKFYIDGTLKGQITDANITGGKIGYAQNSSWNTYVSFDNISWIESSSVPQYTLTTTVAGSGTVSPASGTYDSGTVLSLTATPAAGYTFTGWSGALTGTANPASLTMNANKAVTATFTRVVPRYTLTTTVVGSGTVALSPASGTYDSGTVVSLTATPATGYTFTGWSGSLSGTTNPASLTMNGNKTVTATFTRNIPRYTLTTSVVGSGAVTLSPASGTYDSGTVVSLTATPATGYTFTGWSGALSGSANPTSLIMNSNKNVTATFTAVTVPRYTLTTAVSPAASAGTILPASGVYDSGSVVPITATPAAGYIFTGWSGDLSGSVNPTSVTMNANKSVTANFVALPTTPNSEKLAITAKLFGTDGNVLNDTVDVTVRLYDSSNTAGQVRYAETFLASNSKSVTVKHGYFVVRLGEGTKITDADLPTVLSTYESLWVELQIDSTVMPRTPLTAAAYSLTN